MPPPVLGLQVRPSSSDQQVAESWPVSCDSKVRPVAWSGKRIGSRLIVLPWGHPVAAPADTSDQVAAAGETLSSNRTLSVDRPAWYIVVPDFQLVPIEGSPALLLSPNDEGAAYVLNPGGVAAPGGGGTGRSTRVARAE